MANPKITLTGRLGKDPESVGSGVRLRVATNDRVKNDATGEWQDANTTWWNVKLWKKQADYAKNTLKKGQEVTIVGTIFEDSWNDKVTGEQFKRYEITADSVAVTTYSLQNNNTVTTNKDVWDISAIEPAF